MKLFSTIHDALEAHLPGVTDETDRLGALAYLRGLKTLPATTVEVDDSNVVKLEDGVVQRRIDRVVSEKRQRQLATARDCVQPYCMSEFGWLIYACDDID